MNQQLLLALLLSLFFGIIQVNAQRFQAGFVGGFNLSELEGEDNISSFFGLNTGLVATAKIGEIWSLSTEFLFTKSADYLHPAYYPPADYGKVRLNYLEVPVYLSILTYKRDNYFQKHFSLGISYARLLAITAEDKTGNDLSNQIIWNNKSTLVGHLKVAHYFNPQVGVDFRASLTNKDAYWAWTLAFRAIYLL